jgi:hypothetical protein
MILEEADFEEIKFLYLLRMTDLLQNNKIFEELIKTEN